MILKSLMDGTKNLVQDKVSLSEHQIPRAEEGMTLSLSFFKKKPALLFLFSNFSFLPFIHFWKPYPPHFQWFHWRWPICMTFKDRRLGTWVRSAVISKYLLSAVDFATRYSTRYSDFLLQPYSNPTRSQKSLLVCAWWLWLMKTPTPC